MSHFSTHVPPERPPFGRAAAVLFDCDGTLVDTMGLHFQAWRAAFARHGVDRFLERGEYLALGGVPGEEIVRRICERDGITLDCEAVLCDKRQRVRDLLPSAGVLRPAACWAVWCAGKGVPMAVVSGGTRRIVLATLEAAGLAGLFSGRPVVGAEDTPRGKPHPAPFLLAAEKLGVPPAECVAVEDAPPGLEAARAAGMQVIDIRGFHPEPLARTESHQTS